MHHILMCIQTNHTVEDDDRMEFASDEFYVKNGRRDESFISGTS